MPLPRSYAHAPRLPDGDRVAIDDAVPGAGPVLLEIGAGRGVFALEYAALHPDQRVLALEIRRKLAAHLAERFAERAVPNARCFAEDARAALPRLAPDASVAAVAIHFPDPWWKRKHAKRLVVADALVTELARLVRPGGVVFVQTDVPDRAEEYAAVLRASPTFEPAAPGPRGEYVAESPFAPARSNREKRAIEDGLPIYRIVFRRRAPAPSAPG